MTGSGAGRRPRIGAEILPALMAAIVVGAACGEEEGGPQASGPASEEVPWRADAPVRSGTVDVRLGDPEDADAPELRRISGVEVGPDGRVYVVDHASDRVTVFDSTGAFRFAFGESGEGEGALAGPCCPAFGPDGLLWVREGGNERYSVFEVGERSAELRDTVQIQHAAPEMWAPTTFDGEGRLVDVGRLYERTGELRLVRLHLDEAGEVSGVGRLPRPAAERIAQTTVTRVEEGDTLNFVLAQPYGPRHLVAHGPGGYWAETITDEYAVRWADVQGNVRLVVGPEGAGPEVTAEEREQAEETLAGWRRRFDLAEEELPFGVPERRAVIEDIFFDRSGRLWVELTERTEGLRVADVYTADGVHEARYRWPEEIRLGLLGWEGEETAVGVTADSLGVMRAVRIRFSPE